MRNLLYSDVVKSDAPPTFDTFPTRRKRSNRSHSSHRRVIGKDECDNGNDLAITTVAVQQLSETSGPVRQRAIDTKISWIWDTATKTDGAKIPSGACQESAIPSYGATTKLSPHNPLMLDSKTSSWWSHRPRTSHGRSTQQFTARSRHMQSSSRYKTSVSKIEPDDVDDAYYRPNETWTPTGPDNMYDRPNGTWVRWMDSDVQRVDWVFLPKREERPKPIVKKSRTTFLSLPGELRNQIYAQVLPECRVLVLRSRPNRELETLKNTWSTAGTSHKRPRARLYHKLDNNQMSEGLGLTTNLLLACKAVKKDVELYMYSRTTFCFDSMKVMDQFMQRASFDGLRAIEKLEISHDGYGNPKLGENITFHTRYYDRWRKICTAVGEKLVNLKHLKVNAHLQQWPCDMSRLGLDSEWRNTLLQLAPSGLAKVEIVLYHNMFDRNTQLMKDIARKLEDDMMTDEGRYQRDLSESRLVLAELEAKKAAKRAKRRAAEAKARAPTELTITMDEIKQQTASPVKYCNTGLDKYSRVFMHDMCSTELYAFKEQYCAGKHLQ